MNIILENEFGKETSRSSLFSLFDGHAGSLCANFLKEKLHHYITETQEFKDCKTEALRKGLMKAEIEFFKLARSTPILDISGSCALVALIEGKSCYIANVGDSRMILSSSRGIEVK